MLQSVNNSAIAAAALSTRWYHERHEPWQVVNAREGGSVNAADKHIRITIDDSSGIPIWLQLKNRIIYLITSGYFKPEDRLPTIRELAVELGINYNTVTKVYRDIERDGYITSKRGLGTFVAKRDIGEGEAIRNTAASLTDEYIRQCRELGMPREDIIELVTERLRQTE